MNWLVTRNGVVGLDATQCRRGIFLAKHQRHFLLMLVVNGLHYSEFDYSTRSFLLPTHTICCYYQEIRELVKNQFVNTAATIDSFWNTWRHRNIRREGGESRFFWLPVAAFRGVTGPWHPGARGCQPSGTLSANHNLCEVGVFRGLPWHILPPQTLTTFKNGWVNWGCSQLSTKTFTEKLQQKLHCISV